VSEVSLLKKFTSLKFKNGIYYKTKLMIGNSVHEARYYSGHKESNNLHRDIVILRVLRGAELISQSAFERNIQPAWQSLKLLTRRYLNSGQGNNYAH